MISAKSPKHVIVQKSLQNLIANGVYKEGDTLPSENVLCAQFGITRMTVRNALSTLEHHGLIVRKQGKGSIVQAKRKSIELLSIKGFTEVMKGENIDMESVIVKKPNLQPWPDEFFFELHDLEKAAGSIQMERVRKVQGQPVMYETTFIPNMNLPRFCSKQLINASLFDTLHTTYGIEMLSVKQKLRAVQCTEKYEKVLGVKKGKPLLHIMRKLTTSNDNLNVYSSVFFDSQNHLIEI